MLKSDRIRSASRVIESTAQPRIITKPLGDANGGAFAENRRRAAETCGGCVPLTDSRLVASIAAETGMMIQWEDCPV